MASVKSSPVWNFFNCRLLQQPIRTANDPIYTESIDNIGKDYQHEMTDLIFLQSLSSIDQCIAFLYPHHVRNCPFQCLKHAFLSPRNTFVDSFNETILQLLPERERTFTISKS
jgi:hypothetical protein